MAANDKQLLSRAALSRRDLLLGLPLGGIVLAQGMAKPRVGMLGLDGHIDQILSAQKTTPGVEIQAIWDSNPRQLARVGDRIGVPAERRYTDPHALLDKEKIQIAAVCGADGDRPALVLESIKRGLHVIAEKPLTSKWEDLRQIHAALKAKPEVRLTMLLDMRFSPVFQTMRRIIGSGALGDIVQINGQKSYIFAEQPPRPQWMRQKATFSGTIPYIGIHLVDLMRFTTRQEPVEVAAFQAHIGLPEAGDMENTASVTMRLASGGTADFHLDYMRPANAGTHGDDRLRIVGTKGILEYMESSGLTLATDQEKMHPVPFDPRGPSLVTDFLNATYGSQTPLLSLHDIFRANEIVLAARDAAQTRKVVPIGSVE
jgi:predicted dehydrogenase